VTARLPRLQRIRLAHLLDSLTLVVTAGTVVALMSPTLHRFLEPVAPRLANHGMIGLALVLVLPFVVIGVCWPKALLGIHRSIYMLFAGHVGLFWKVVLAWTVYSLLTRVFSRVEVPALAASIWVALFLVMGLVLGSLCSALMCLLRRPSNLATGDSGEPQLRLSSDNPLVLIAEDRFEHARLAEKIAYQLWGLPTERTEPCPSVALIGPYGSGKTTVCSFVEEIYRMRRAERAWPEVIFAKFEAWPYQTSQAALHALVGAASRAISEKVDDLGLRAVPRDFLRAATTAAGPFGQLAAPLRSRERTPGDVLGNLGDVLLRLNLRLVLFIDDLDRIEDSTPETLRAIVRALNDLQNVPNVQYVVAMDTSGPSDGGEKAAVDLLKLTQYQNTIPEMSWELSLGLVREVRDQASGDPDCFYPWAWFDDEQRDPLAWNSVYEYAGLPLYPKALLGLLGTPRALLTALRAAVHRWQGGLDGEINWHDLLLLCALDVSAPDVVRWIGREQRLFTDGKTRDPTGDEATNDEVTSRLARYTKGLDLDRCDAVRNALAYLFPPLAGVLRSPGFWDRGVNAAVQHVCARGTGWEARSYLTRYFQDLRREACRDRPTLEYIRRVREGAFDAGAFQESFLSSREKLMGPLNKIVQFSPFIDLGMAFNLCDAILAHICDPTNASTWHRPAEYVLCVVADVAKILQRAGQRSQPETHRRGNRRYDIFREDRLRSRVYRRFLTSRVRRHATTCPLVACSLLGVFESEHFVGEVTGPAREAFRNCFLAGCLEGGSPIVGDREDPRWFLRTLLPLLETGPEWKQLKPKLTAKLLHEAGGENARAVKHAIIWTLAKGYWVVDAPNNDAEKIDTAVHAQRYDMGVLLPELRGWAKSDLDPDGSDAWAALKAVLSKYESAPGEEASSEP